MTVRQRLLAPALALKRLFGRPSSPWVPVAFYGPVALACVLTNLIGDRPPAWAWVVLPAAGLLFWTLLEYVLHSQLFHVSPSSRLAWLSEPHLNHHEVPDDPTEVVARLSFTLPVAVVVYGALCLALWSARWAALVMAGVVVGYLGYEVIHYAIHQVPWARRLMRPLASHHLHHHYADPSRCFGVSTRLWDWVFHTGRRARDSSVRARAASANR